MPSQVGDPCGFFSAAPRPRASQDYHNDYHRISATVFYSYVLSPWLARVWADAQTRSMTITRNAHRLDRLLVRSRGDAALFCRLLVENDAFRSMCAHAIGINTRRAGRPDNCGIQQLIEELESKIPEAPEQCQPVHSHLGTAAETIGATDCNRHYGLARCSGSRPRRRSTSDLRGARSIRLFPEQPMRFRLASSRGLTAARPSGFREQRTIAKGMRGEERTIDIRFQQTEKGQLILQGLHLGRGWSMSITKEAGSMSLAISR